MDRAIFLLPYLYSFSAFYFLFSILILNYCCREILKRKKEIILNSTENREIKKETKRNTENGTIRIHIRTEQNIKIQTTTNKTTAEIKVNTIQVIIKLQEIPKDPTNERDHHQRGS